MWISSILVVLEGRQESECCGLGAAQSGPLLLLPQSGKLTCPFVGGPSSSPSLTGKAVGAILLEERSRKTRQVPPSSKLLTVSEPGFLQLVGATLPLAAVRVTHPFLHCWEGLE